MDKDVARSKKQRLLQNLSELDSLLVAFSGGVDSTFLVALAHQALGEKLLTVIASAQINPIRETEGARNFARKRGIRHLIIHPEVMSLPEFVSNTAERCYYCKRNLLELLFKVARENDIKQVAHGANVDDLKDFRPGFRAAREMGVIAPLVDVKLGKKEIRFLSKEMGLDTWDKPAMACLASRIPYGDAVTEKKLKMVADAEDFLAQNGFKQFRVRCHGSMARIEVENQDIEKIAEAQFRKRLMQAFKQIGFMHIAVDLEGYVSGSMNRALVEAEGKGTPK